LLNSAEIELVFTAVHYLTLQEETRAHMVLMSVACLTGLFFGFRYKFAALIPVTAAALLARSLMGAFEGQAVSSIMLDLVLLAFALQSGYIIGLISCDLFSQIASRWMTAPSKRG
jgi:hypothetical protein